MIDEGAMEAARQLRDHQQQLDMDGVTVGVSRQAIDEVLAELDRLRALLSQERSDGARTPPNTRLRNVVEQMLAAIERGAIDSEENAGEPEVGIPPHRWHEEWSFYARAALDASPPLSPWRAGELP